MADELRTLYPQFQHKIADLFARIATNNKQIIDLHGRCPVGVPQRLRGAELKARNLAVFDSYTKSLAKTLQLPAWHADEPNGVAATTAKHGGALSRHHPDSELRRAL